ncbi:MAG: hypothetical protein FWB88_07825 [Defluviitaleaceae bacterium]|nr:hypothetical protein [Defluviitaleaceae bacterium]MCL2240104.1 hypothetical protein [Defluviitaleaceae bacterium]
MNQQMPHSDPYSGGGPGGPMMPPPGKGFGTAALVLGIIGVVFADPILGILAIIFAVVAKRKGFTGGTATAGLVLGIIASAFGFIVLAICGPILCAFFTAL